MDKISESITDQFHRERSITAAQPRLSGDHTSSVGSHADRVK